MSSNLKQITSNNLLDNLLINLPIWFPLAYIFLSVNLPLQSTYLFIAVLFLFAETHFASTWLFFFDKDNWSWIKNNSYKIIFLPLYFLILLFLTWFFSPTLIIFLHYLASGWHVTNQSIGIIKIYCFRKKFYQFLVYFVSFSCLAIGLNNPGVFAEVFSVQQVNLFLLVSFICYLLVLTLNSLKLIPSKLLDFFPLLTGVVIYLPILFFENISTATAVGVGIHWCQYIAIVWTTYIRKNFHAKNKKFIFSKLPNLSRLTFIFIYSALMTYLAFIGMPKIITNSPEYSIAFLIPILFQIYHFYIDGFIWKFSDPHIKNSVLKYLYKS